MNYQQYDISHKIKQNRIPPCPSISDQVSRRPAVLTDLRRYDSLAGPSHSRMTSTTYMCPVHSEIRCRIMLCHARHVFTLFLDAKKTINFVMSVRRSAWTTLLSLDGFSWNLILECFSKMSRKFKVSLKSTKNTGHFTWRPMYIFIALRSIIRRMRNVSGKRCRESHNTNSTISNLPLPENRTV